MASQFGWDGARPERVVIVNDLIQAVMSAILANSDPGDGVALQVPAYPAFLGIVNQSGRLPVLNPMRDTGTGLQYPGPAYRGNAFRIGRPVTPV
jgi:cystathionine beta-lyase